MENVPEIITYLFGGGAAAILGRELITWAKEAATGRAATKRNEVDRAIKERDEANARADASDDRADAAENSNRMVREDLYIHRRVIIEAPCLGPGHLPPISDASKGVS